MYVGVPTAMPVAVSRAPAFHRPRDAEVGDHRATRSRVEQDVVRLDVAMDDAAQVRVRERVGDLAEEAAHLVDRLARLAARGACARLPPVDERHDEVGDAVALADVVDRHDVRVRELRRRLRLAREARRGSAWSCASSGGRTLIATGRFEPEVARAVDDGHAAAADLVLELVVLADGGERRDREGTRS